MVTGITGDSGEFRFTGLHPLPYFVSVQVRDFDPVSVAVDLRFEVADNINIYLKRTAARHDSPSALPVSVHELSMPPKARTLYASGQKKLYQGNNSNGAVSDFQQALELAPDFYEASYQLGMAYLSLNNPGLAEGAFRKSIESSHDTYGESDVRLGSLLLDHSSPEAETFIRKGAQLSPTFWRAHYELGRLLVSQNRPADALPSAEQARALAPNVPVVYRLLSSIHFAQHNYPALLQDLDAYISLDPDSPNGRGAKQLRDEIQQKLSRESVPLPPNP